MSVDELPQDWRTITITERRDRIADGLGIPENGSMEMELGDLSSVFFSRSGIRHSLKEYKSLEKDALMMNSKALLQTMQNAHYEKDEPNTKSHVDKTMRYKGRTLIDGKEYIVGFIVHHNAVNGQFQLYHISLYDK